MLKFSGSQTKLINFNQLFSSQFHGCELLQLLSTPTLSSPQLLLLQLSLIKTF